MELSHQKLQAETSEGLWWGNLLKFYPCFTVQCFWVRGSQCVCLVVRTVLYCWTSWHWWIICISTAKKMPIQNTSKMQGTKNISLLEWSVFHSLACLVCEGNGWQSIVRTFILQSLKCISFLNCDTVSWLYLSIIIDSYCLCICEDPCDQMYNFNSATVMYLCQIAC